MPFTFAHPAIILPFGKSSNRWISLTGLIIGSMVPDFEYFFRLRVSSIYSHTLSGLIWFDIPLGLLLIIIHQQIIKNKLIDQLPYWLYQRFSMFKTARVRYSANYIAALVICVAAGAVTHLLWDGFTHPTGYFVQVIPALTCTIHLLKYNLYFYKILQHTSILVGLLVIIWCILSLPRQKIKRKYYIKHYWLQILLTAFTVLIIRFFTGLGFNRYGDWIVSGIAGLLLGLLVASITPPNKTLPQT